MKERHPIDDLFRKGLYDSEATPPADVWQRVVAQRSWGHRLLVGLQRRWAVGLVGAALLLTPLAWYAASSEHAAEVAQEQPRATSSAGVNGTDMTMNAGPDATAQYAAGHVEAAEPKETVAAVVNDRTTSTASTHQTSGTPEDRAKSRNASSRPNTGGSTTGAGSRSSGLERGTALGNAAKDASGVAARSEQGSDERDVPGEAARRDERIKASGADAIGSASQADTEENYVAEDMMMLRTRLAQVDRALDNMKTAAKPVEAPYVLPHGAWWLGVQFGWNDWNGGWRGEGRLAEELKTAETWQGGWQAGFVGGRTWRSGLSVSAGVEYASLKSRFLFSENRHNSSDTSTAMVLDTTWSVNAIAPDSSYVVYTYDIAYVPVEGYSDEVRYSATNRYALLSLPVEVACQWNIGRITLAPRAGAAFNWFIGRDGRTLVASASDGSPRAVALSDARAVDRFGMWITGSVGGDVGFALDERTQVFAGGAYTTLLTGGNEIRPSLSGAQLRLRLVREFGLKPRKAKLP